MNNDPIFVRMNNELNKQGRMQKDLIEYLGMGKGTYTQWKIAANHSYRSHLPEIAEYLDISLDYLAGLITLIQTKRMLGFMETKKRK